MPPEVPQWTDRPELAAADPEFARLITVRILPFAVSIVRCTDGRVTWSAGILEGEDWTQGTAPTIAAAKLAALGEIRRRLAEVGTRVDALERAVDPDQDDG